MLKIFCNHRRFVIACPSDLLQFGKPVHDAGADATPQGVILPCRAAEAADAADAAAKHALDVVPRATRSTAGSVAEPS